MLRKAIHNSSVHPDDSASQDSSFGTSSGFGLDLNTNASDNKALSSVEQAEIRKRQVDQAVRAIPLHIFFMVCAALTIAILEGTKMGEFARIAWYVAGFLPALIHGYAWISIRRNRNEDRTIRILEVAALIQGIAWTIPLSFFLKDTITSSQSVIIGVSLAMAGVGALALSRIPTGAIVLSGLIVGASVRAVYFHMESSTIAPSILCGIYGIVLTGIVVSMHWEFLRATRAELEVGRQRQVIALLLNDFEKGTSDWLWETDREGKVTYFSPRFAEAIGKIETEILGHTFDSIVDPDQTQHGWSAFTSAMARQVDIPSVLLSLSLNNKSLYWQMTARPLYSDEDRFLGYRGVGRDVSEKWSSDQAIRDAKDNAERANVAKSQFLSIVGHEIRTPLNAIVGFAELLMSSQGETLPQKSRRDFLNTILESAHHLQALINDVLDTTRIEKGTLRLIEQEVDAAEVIEVAAKLCREQAEKAGVSLIVRVDEGVRIVGDQPRLKQIMLNLLTNAIKFSPSGSIVNADSHRGPNNEFIFSVKDAGIGIKPEDVERVFEPFVQADEGNTRRFGGLGLGLSLARKIARLHGGDITLLSSHGTGTTARLSLPPSRIVWPDSHPQVKTEAAA